MLIFSKLPQQGPLAPSLHPASPAYAFWVAAGLLLAAFALVGQALVWSTSISEIGGKPQSRVQKVRNQPLVLLILRRCLHKLEEEEEEEVRYFCPHPFKSSGFCGVG